VFLLRSRLPTRKQKQQMIAAKANGLLAIAGCTMRDQPSVAPTTALAVQQITYKAKDSSSVTGALRWCNYCYEFWHIASDVAATVNRQHVLAGTCKSLRACRCTCLLDAAASYQLAEISSLAPHVACGQLLVITARHTLCKVDYTQSNMPTAANSTIWRI
jgi:hypothetical protein